MPTHRETLIAAVRALGHTDAEVARRIGIDRAQLARIAQGKENMPPEVAALLAELCGQDAQQALARQVVENAKEPRRSMLERALFTLGAHCVAFACLGTPTVTDAKQIAGDQITNKVSAGFTLYTLCCIVKAWGRRCLRSLARSSRRSDHQGLRPRYPGDCVPPSGSPC